MTPRTLQHVILQLVSAFDDFSNKNKLLHGNFDQHSVYIKETPSSEFPKVTVDLTESEGIMRLLKQVSDQELEKSDKGIRPKKKVCQ